MNLTAIENFHLEAIFKLEASSILLLRFTTSMMN